MTDVEASRGEGAGGPTGEGPHVRDVEVVRALAGTRDEQRVTATDEVLGMEYHSSLEELKWTNRRGQPVRGLYVLRVEARSTRAPAAGGSTEPTDSAEVYVYRP